MERSDRSGNAHVLQKALVEQVRDNAAGSFPFGEVQAFLQQNEDISPVTRPKLLEVLNDP